MKINVFRILLSLGLFIVLSDGLTGQDVVCEGNTEYYAPDPVSEGNYFQWTIVGGNEGVDWTIISENTYDTDIEWITPGNYTLTRTEIDINSDEIVEITTIPVVVNALPVATISYPGSPFCPVGTAVVLRSGPEGGTYSPSSPGFLSIDPSTGVIDLAGSIPDTYTVFYEFSMGGCYNITSTTVVINALPEATINYPEVTYCQSGTASVSLTGTTGGTFSSASGVIINGSTGEIDLTISAPGTYTITYSFTDVCSSSTSAEITINPSPVASISYSSPDFCTSGTAEVIQTGQQGGLYSAEPGLEIDLTTGSIDLDNSLPGNYTVVYSFSDGTCSNSAVTGIIINDQPTAAIIYSDVPDCAAGIVSVTQTGQPDGTYSSSEGLSINSITGDINLSESDAGTYTVTYSFAVLSCSNTTATSVTVSGYHEVPAAAGPITGSSTLTAGAISVPYSVGVIDGASDYIWTYSGEGVTINGSGPDITLDFSLSATEGFLEVKGSNICGLGTESSLFISPYKTLNLTSVMLQGLYNGFGTMRQAYDEFGPHWPAGVADHITVELHSNLSYGNIIYTANDVTLNTDGTATISVPGVYNGSFYITIKHRNSIETTTASPVSFGGSTVNQSFGSLANIYGGNLSASIDGRYLIYAGDVNQDGFIDTQDYSGIDNDSYNYVSGYLATDVDGNGMIDTDDYIFIDNNNYNYIGAILP